MQLRLLFLFPPLDGRVLAFHSVAIFLFHSVLPYTSHCTKLQACYTRSDHRPLNRISTPREKTTGSTGASLKPSSVISPTMRVSIVRFHLARALERVSSNPLALEHTRWRDLEFCRTAESNGRCRSFPAKLVPASCLSISKTTSLTTSSGRPSAHGRYFALAQSLVLQEPPPVSPVDFTRKKTQQNPSIC